MVKFSHSVFPGLKKGNKADLGKDVDVETDSFAHGTFHVLGPWLVFFSFRMQ